MPSLSKVDLRVSSGCTGPLGFINATVSSNNYVPAGSQPESVGIHIYGTETGYEYYSAYQPGSASVSVNNLQNDYYEISAWGSSNTETTMVVKYANLACTPPSDITITPNLSTPGTIVLDLTSVNDIATDVYTWDNNSLPSYVTLTKTTITSKKRHTVAVIDPIVNVLTFKVTVTDKIGYSEALTVYYRKVSYTKNCGANQVGTYTSIKSAFSLISMQDAYDKARNLAVAEADTNLKCDTDIKFEEVQMADTSFTVSYSLENQSWVCFHDYKPDAIFCTANLLMSFKETNIYIHNQINRKGRYYYNNLSTLDITVYRSQIEFMIANLLSKAYHAINWKSQNTTERVINEKTTFNAIMIYNHNQCSGELPITLQKTTRNAEGVWRFNDFRDLVKDPNSIFLDIKGNVIPASLLSNKAFFKKSRFIGDYICVRLIFDNFEMQPEIVLSDFSINDKVSFR